MKRNLILIIALFVQIVSYGQSKQTNVDSSKAAFHTAYESLKNMLQGNDSLNYEKAVFITENAYYHNILDYNVFEKALDRQTFFINAIAENARQGYLETHKNMNVYAQKMLDLNAKNWAIFKYITDTTVIFFNHYIYCKEPYNYSADDPYGSNQWENTQVLHLLTGDNPKGNCYALAVLFKIFSDRLKSDARLTIAPHHIYIQNRNEKGDFYNVELAAKAFPGDGSIQTLTYTTNTSIMNGMAQRMLTDKEAIALNLIYLAKGYEHKFKDNTNDFLMQCANLAFKYDTLSLNALLLKAEVTENRLFEAMQQNKITTISQTQKNTQTQILLADYEKQLSNLYKCGYREIPEDIQRIILARINHTTTGAFVQDKTPNPFKEIGANQRYATLSGGLFDEMHENVDTIQYNRALLNTKTGKIIALLPHDTTLDYKADPVVFALSVDPLSAKYPNLSPYVPFNDNPIVYVDPDGKAYVPTNKDADVVLREKSARFGQVLQIPNPEDNNNIYTSNANFQSEKEFRTILKNSDQHYTNAEIEEAVTFYNGLKNPDVYEVETTVTKGKDYTYGNTNSGSTTDNKDLQTNNDEYAKFHGLVSQTPGQELTQEVADALYKGAAVNSKDDQGNAQSVTINPDSRGNGWALFKNKNFGYPTVSVKGVIVVDITNKTNDQAFKEILNGTKSDTNNGTKKSDTDK